MEPLSRTIPAAMRWPRRSYADPPGDRANNPRPGAAGPRHSSNTPAGSDADHRTISAPCLVPKDHALVLEGADLVPEGNMMWPSRARSRPQTGCRSGVVNENGYRVILASSCQEPTTRDIRLGVDHWHGPHSVPAALEHDVAACVAGPRAPKLSWPWMASIELDGPDAPACPFLGLAADRRSHFMYSHPGHRCFAAKHAAAVDARRQSAYCLNLGFAACDRYRAWQRRAGSGRQAEAQRPAEGDPARRASAATTTAAPGTTVVHVLRAGDSLDRIAAAYGLTVEQIATANGFTLNDGVAVGARLVIPLGPPAASGPRGGPRAAAGR